MSGDNIIRESKNFLFGDNDAVKAKIVAGLEQLEIDLYVEKYLKPKYGHLGIINLESLIECVKEAPEVKEEEPVQEAEKEVESKGEEATDEKEAGSKEGTEVKPKKTSAKGSKAKAKSSK